MEQFLSRMEAILAGFERMFGFFQDLMQQVEAEEKEYQQGYGQAKAQEKSRYKCGYMTEYYIEKVDAGNSCLQELIDSRDRYEKLRAQKGYPIDKSYHGPLAEAISVLEARQPVTVEQLRERVEAGELELEDILLGVQIREEAKECGWKNSHKPVEAEEAELANYREVLNGLKQPQL